ncbi:zinc-dependent alcohol dehydrogenase [Halegenticoccus tardaugens]|uniref:zinc-dependent alcohol dehydrogenase n=1 Tax=Halegenticoccus tardaugens TaxID=2071624 RepID=UPI00100BDB6B|nr:zinc-binding alcohol dehydrogenase [Halegenticoccus tardaugens]
MPARSLYFTGERTVEVRERTVPDPGPDEVRVRSVASAISSGTELLVYRGDAPSDLPADENIPALDGSLEYPLRYGYATVGTVTATGDDVDEDWLDRTVFCFHPHESHFLASPDELRRVPNGCSTTAAALLPTVETALNFVMDGRPSVGERVVVFGQGPVGLLSTAVLSSFPLGRLVTVDTVARRRDLSLSFGADESLPPADARSRFDVGPRVDPNTPRGADLSFELTGDPAALEDAVSVTGYDGTVVIGSWYGDKRAELDLGGRFHRSRIQLKSSQVSTIDPDHRGRWTQKRRFELAWRWLERLDVDRLVTHRLPLSEARTAYELLDSQPGEAVQILFTYGGR